jgi:hypothetical protein
MRVVISSILTRTVLVCVSLLLYMFEAETNSECAETNSGLM